MPRTLTSRPRPRRRPTAAPRARGAKPRAASPAAVRDSLDLLRRLSEASGISGDESAVRQIVLEAIGERVEEVQVDALGNVLVRARPSSRRGLRVMLAAHMDEVGLMVLGATAEGMLKFDLVGGLDERALVAKPVWVGHARVAGVIGGAPPHLIDWKGELTPYKVDALGIDIGARTKEEALARVRPGDGAVFATRFERVGSTLRGKALDDRVGVATLIELVLDPPPGIQLLAAFTTQEEIGLRGASVAAHALDPQAAIILDCTPANDQPLWDGSENTTYNTRLGMGPAIYVGDRGTLPNPRLIEHLVRSAEAAGLPYQRRQPGGGSTDAAAIHLARKGIPSISLSVPGRYLHTPIAMIHFDDWRASVALVRTALARLRPETIR
jgi:putative aminopeptidase FrvX